MVIALLIVCYTHTREATDGQSRATVPPSLPATGADNTRQVLALSLLTEDIFIQGAVVGLACIAMPSLHTRADAPTKPEGGLLTRHQKPTAKATPVPHMRPKHNSGINTYCATLPALGHILQRRPENKNLLCVQHVFQCQHSTEDSCASLSEGCFARC